MTCERCGERPGEIQYTEYADGESKKLRICRECAAELGFELEEEASRPAKPPKAGKVLGVVSVQATVETGLEPENDPEDQRCPACGATSVELEKHSLFGCPECYEAFAEALEPLLRRVQGKARHRGRLPGGGFVEGEDPAAEAGPEPGAEAGPDPDSGGDP